MTDRLMTDVAARTPGQELRDRLVAFGGLGHAGKYASLDGFRAVAALGVVVYHVAGYARILADGTPLSRFLENLGNFGVATFFLLSGFLLYRGFVLAWFRGHEAPNPFSYLRRRFMRIMPGYWVALTAFLLLGLDVITNQGPDYFFSLFSLTQVYRQAYGLSGLPVAWTLCIEVSFYLLLPLIAGLIQALGRHATTLRMKLEVQLVGIATLAAITLIWRWFVAGPAQFDNTNYAFTVFHIVVLNYFDWFALGMLLAVLASWREVGRSLPPIVDRLVDRGWLCWVLAAACYGTLMYLRTPGLSTGQQHETTVDVFVRFGLNGFAAFFFLLPAVLGRQDGRIVRTFSAPLAVFLGTVSYGIYLWHKVWLDWIDQHQEGFNRVPFWPMLIWVLALTIASASLSFYLVERPCLRFKQSKKS